MRRGDSVDRHETNVVSVLGVTRARISQADDQDHEHEAIEKARPLGCGRAGKLRREKRRYFLAAGLAGAAPLAGAAAAPLAGAGAAPPLAGAAAAPLPAAAAAGAAAGAAV